MTAAKIARMIASEGTRAATRMLDVSKVIAQTTNIRGIIKMAGKECCYECQNRVRVHASSPSLATKQCAKDVVMDQNQILAIICNTHHRLVQLELWLKETHKSARKNKDAKEWKRKVKRDR